ncbi:MAG: TOBE domain-containing protein, partial [Rubrivivax sp.]|nr:TOBE domain-containing protein [Rubrivivax sp.]
AEVTLALRPEHLCPAAAGTLQGRVQLVEPMGNHHVLWIEFAGQVLACLVHGAPAVRAGDALRFDVDTRQALLFDRTSGERLATGELPCH